MVLVPGGLETPKNPPSPCPSPALGRGEQLRGWCKIVGGSRGWKVKEEPWVPVQLCDGRSNSAMYVPDLHRLRHFGPLCPCATGTWFANQTGQMVYTVDSV